MKVLKWKTLCDNDIVELSIPGGNKPSFVASLPRTINRISRELNELGVRHSVDEESFQIDDGPEALTLDMNDYRDTDYLLRVLDRMGQQTPPSFPHQVVTIPGHFIASKRFQIGIRAMEVFKAGCDRANIDLLMYDIAVTLEPKGSRKFENVKLPQEWENDYM